MAFMRWRTALFFGLAVIVVGVVLVFQVMRGERVHAFYPTYEAAKLDGAVARGWISSFVPPSATEIYEEHDLDTNQVWIRFRIPRSDAQLMVQAMHRLTDSEILSLRCTSPEGRWWFEALVQQAPANDNALNAEIYVGERERAAGKVYVAIDRVEPIVYHWCEQ